MGKVHGLAAETEASVEDGGDDHCNDSDVPSSAVIRAVTGLDIAAADIGWMYCVTAIAKDSENGDGLISSNVEEDVWAWQNGRL